MPTVLFDIGDHQIANDAHLMGMRPLRRRDLGNHLWRGRVRHVDDRCAVRRCHVTDVGIVALYDDLTAAGNVEPAKTRDVL